MLQILSQCYKFLANIGWQFWVRIGWQCEPVLAGSVWQYWLAAWANIGWQRGLIFAGSVALILDDRFEPMLVSNNQLAGSIEAILASVSNNF